MPDEAAAYFSGRLSKHAELKESAKGTAYAHVSIHVEKAGYFDLTAFDDVAKKVGAWQEGDAVEIKANIGKRKYQDKWQTQFIITDAKQVQVQVESEGGDDGITF